MSNKAYISLFLSVTSLSVVFGELWCDLFGKDSASRDGQQAGANANGNSETGCDRAVRLLDSRRIRDQRQGLELLMRLANQVVPEAQFQLGKRFFQLGSDAGIACGKECLERAASQGYQPARVLHEQYFPKSGGNYPQHRMTTNHDRFVPLMDRAAQGDRDAQFQLGEYFIKDGDGSLIFSLEYLRRAADQGHPKAQEQYGWRLFCLSKEEPEDQQGIEAARHYLELAAQQGRKKARELLTVIGY
ncbi:MAG: hypothetical protein LBF72_02915 [Holosporales bacterium]|nr:hypothetical protein [Holosporales bacterium]